MDVPEGWITPEDAGQLMQEIDSGEPAAPVVSPLSSYWPYNQTSTVGNEALFLLEGYRTGGIRPISAPYTISNRIGLRWRCGGMLWGMGGLIPLFTTKRRETVPNHENFILPLLRKITLPLTSKSKQPSCPVRLKGRCLIKPCMMSNFHWLCM